MPSTAASTSSATSTSGRAGAEAAPPIWIPGGGSVETWQWCAEMDHVYAYLSYFGYKAGQVTMRASGDGPARQGSNPYRPAFCSCWRRRDRERLIDTTASGRVFYGRRLHVDPASPARRAIPARRRNAPGWSARSPKWQGCASSTPSHARWTIVDKGYVIIGPDEGAEQLNEAATDPMSATRCADAVRQHGQGSGDVQHKAVRREGHAPADRCVFGVEDRWWPKPMSRDAGA